MRVCLEWLNDIVDLKDLPLKHIEDRMIMSGSKVETVDKVAEGIDGIVVGQITQIVKHPEADRLQICQVDLGNRSVQIVTGATNVFEGARVPVALVGATLPGGKSIGTTAFRGVESQGMLCSLEELGFEDAVIPKKYVDAIFIIADDLPLGESAIKAFKLDDHVIEFEITPNRPDCLSMIGMAREAAATFERPYQKSSTAVTKAVSSIEGKAFVEVQDADLCPRFVARVVQNVVIKESPLWLKMRLMKSGMRPINNIVDITNYVMLEYGQPIHAYDLAEIAGRKLIVRRAAEGETLKTLDDKVRQLDNSMLLITDSEKPLGIAGIMGGETGEVSDSTTAILIEVAHFNKSSVRETSKRLGLRSEASNRFEKGTDREAVLEVADRVCHLIESMGYGQVIDGVIDIEPAPYTPIQIEARIERINQLIGIRLTGDEMAAYLRRLDLKVAVKAETLIIDVPSYRLDLIKEIDIVEEVARMYGYDQIPATLPKDSSWGALNRSQHIEAVTKKTLVAEGFKEIVTYTFISPSAYDKIRTPKDSHLRQVVQVKNPLGEEYSVMRTTLMPSMLEVLERNYKRDVQQAEVFEIGTLFFPKALPVKELPLEKKGLIMALMGEDYDFYALKGALENYLQILGIEDLRYEALTNHTSYHSGRCATVHADGRVIGQMGEIHPLTAEVYGIKCSVFAAELDLDLIIELTKTDVLYQALPKYPSSRRDIAILIDAGITAGKVVETVGKYATELLETCELFDVYTGKQVPEGKKSMAYALTFRAQDRTMTEEEIQTAYQAILKGLEKELSAELR